jgi:hypothetical protein
LPLGFPFSTVSEKVSAAGRLGGSCRESELALAAEIAAAAAAQMSMSLIGRFMRIPFAWASQAKERCRLLLCRNALRFVTPPNGGV